jgi:hypothetical protein
MTGALVVGFTIMFAELVDVVADGLTDTDADADIESVGSITAPPVSLAEGAGSELTDTAVLADFGEPPLEMM